MVVLIPPPHEPEQAPMNMATQVNINDAGSMAPTSITLKPAVRADAE